MNTKKYRKLLRGADKLFAMAVLASQEDGTLLLDKESQRHMYNIMQHLMISKTLLQIENGEDDDEKRIII